MRRATIILLLFLIIAAAIIGLSQFLQNQPPLEITIAVDPLAEDWIQDAAAAFNESAPVVNATQRVLVNITVMNDVRVWNDNPNWTSEVHPVGWIAASSASVEYTPSNLPFSIVQPSLAQTPLVWGGYQSRVDVLTNNGAEAFGWDAVAEAAAAERWERIGGEPDWNFIKLAFNRPSSSMAGVAVLISGAAHFNGSDTLSPADIGGSAFGDWLQPIVDSVPNFQTLGANPAVTMAGRGTSVVEIALLPESQWLTTLDDFSDGDAIIFAYPDYQFLMDFPLALWDDTITTDDERAAVTAFGTYLLGAEMQSLAETYGLRPANGSPSADIFTQAVSAGVQIDPDWGIPVQIPDRTETARLIQRLN